MSKTNFNTDKYLVELKKVYAKKLSLVGVFLKGEAQSRCPVLTGYLQGSINFKVDPNELSVTVGTPVEYALEVEMGDASRKRTPYLRPALYDNVDRIEKLLHL